MILYFGTSSDLTEALKKIGGCRRFLVFLAKLESLCELHLIITTQLALGKMRKTGRAANLINGMGDKHTQYHLGTEGL